MRGEPTGAGPGSPHGSQPTARQKRVALGCFLVGLGAPVLLVAHFFLTPGRRAQPPAVVELLRAHNTYALSVIGGFTAAGVVLVGLGIAVLASARRMRAAGGAEAEGPGANPTSRPGGRTADGKTWEQRLWDHWRPNLWWLLPALALLDLFLLARLGRAMDGMAYVGRPGRRHWISMDVDPFGYWWSVLNIVGALVCLLGVPLWVAFRARTINRRRARCRQAE